MASISLPTDRADWLLVVRTVRLVFGRPVYALLGFVLASTTLTALVLSLNGQFVRDVVLFGTAPLDVRLELVALQFPFVGPTFSPLQGTLIVLIAILAGIDLTVLVYHVREHVLSIHGGSGSVVGVFFGVLGAGCAACGPAVLGGMLSLVGGAALFALLPLEGLEIAIASVGMLLLSLYWLADGMRAGRIAGCPIEPTNR